MPDLSTILLFALTALSLNVTPGPDMLYVVARSVEQGRRAGIISALGLSVGYLVHTLLAASGLAALLTASPAVFNGVKVIGAVYLVYLGLRTLLTQDAPPVAAESGAEAPAAAPTNAAGAVFRQGALTSTLNPSIAIFFLALLPQFVDAARGSVAGQIVILGLVFITTATTTHTAIALLTGTAGNWLRGRSSTARWQRRFSGGLLILLGARVLVQGG